MVAVLNTGSRKHEIANPDGPRWYDPTVGQWLSEDPTGLTADANPFRYAGNSPSNAIDPTGLRGLPEEQDPGKFNNALNNSLSGIADQAFKARVRQILLAMQQTGGALGAITYDAVVHKHVKFLLDKSPTAFPNGGPNPRVVLGRGPLFGAEQIFGSAAIHTTSGNFPGKPGPNPGDLGTLDELPPFPSTGAQNPEDVRAALNAQMVIVGHEIADAALGTHDFFNPSPAILGPAATLAIGNLNKNQIPTFNATTDGVNEALENIFRLQLGITARASYILCPLESQKAFNQNEIDNANAVLHKYAGVGTLAKVTVPTANGRVATRLELTDGNGEPWSNAVKNQPTDSAFTP